MSYMDAKGYLTQLKRVVRDWNVAVSESKSVQTSVIRLVRDKTRYNLLVSSAAEPYEVIRVLGTIFTQHQDVVTWDFVSNCFTFPQDQLHVLLPLVSRHFCVQIDRGTIERRKRKPTPVPRSFQPKRKTPRHVYNCICDACEAYRNIQCRRVLNSIVVETEKKVHCRYQSPVIIASSKTLNANSYSCPLARICTHCLCCKRHCKCAEIREKFKRDQAARFSDIRNAQNDLFRAARERLRWRKLATPTASKVPIDQLDPSEILARHARNQYFAALGLSPGATIQEIKERYRKLALLYHPDKAGSGNSTPIFIAISQAYNKLVIKP